MNALDEFHLLEWLIWLVWSHYIHALSGNAGQVDLLRELDYTLRLDKQVKDAFHALRKLGNPATHDITSSSHRDALQSLQVGHALSAWFHQQFGGDKATNFKLAAFVKPQDPSENALPN